MNICKRTLTLFQSSKSRFTKRVSTNSPLIKSYYNSSNYNSTNNNTYSNSSFNSSNNNYQSQPSQPAVHLDPTKTYIPISRNRFISINYFNNKVYVDIRQYTESNGYEFSASTKSNIPLQTSVFYPSKKGISLTEEQWNALKESVNEVEPCIDDLKNTLRAEGQTEPYPARDPPSSNRTNYPM